METTHNWLQLLESGRDIGAIFFDFKKAFDSVPHHALMDKLKAINLNPLLLHWIQSQQVLVNGEKLDPLPVLSGVPQGSIIGPLLFLIYIKVTAPQDAHGKLMLQVYLGLNTSDICR